MKDYRISHISERKSIQYEYDIFKRGSYDDFLWQVEHEIIQREFAYFANQIANMHYLDFACGTGRILALGEQYAQESIGIDIAPAMLDIARNKIKHSSLILGDLTREDYFRYQSFDIITAFRFFLNAQCELQDSAMKVLVSKLRDRDSVLIFNMHGNMWSHRILTKLWYWIRGHRLNVSSYWRVKLLTKKHDLKIIRWYGFGWVPKVFYRIFDSSTMFALDRVIAKIPGARYFAYDLIFVCRSRKNS